MSLNELTLKDGLTGVSQGQFSAEEVTKACLTEIQRKDGKIHSFLAVAPDGRSRQSSISSTALLGLPIALKDNILTKNFLTTAASHVLKNFQPPYDATVVRRLTEAGA